MSDEKERPIGSIVHTDLTVPMTEQVRDFYKAVIGWQSSSLEMSDDDGTYEDYVMMDSEGNAVSGVCHPRGSNAILPPVWLVYFQVADVAASINKVTELGGKVVTTMPDGQGGTIFAIIQDPAGAHIGIMKS
jgi:hypothetical protein